MEYTLKIDVRKNIDNICKFIKSEVINQKKSGVIIGLSGGIDSSLVATLCVKAIGPKKVLGITLPEEDNSLNSIKYAKKLANHLKINIDVFNISDIIRSIGVYDIVPVKYRKKPEKILKLIKKLSKITKNNPFAYNYNINNKYSRVANTFMQTKDRVRATLLYFYAKKNNLLLVGAVNKSEYSGGLFTEHGDLIGDIMLLKNFYKSHIYQLAHELKVPPYILNRKPTPDMIKGLDDEMILGCTYKSFDYFLLGLEMKRNKSEILKKANINSKTYNNLIKLIRNSEYTRSPKKQIFQI